MEARYQERCVWGMPEKRPICAIRVDVNKWDDDNPEIRCRVVVQELHRDKRVDIVAPPPLEGKKILFSMATTEGIEYA